MANVKAIASGNYSNPAIWEFGAVPTSNDVVDAGGYTVTIDQDVAAVELATVYGGRFQVVSGEYLIVADIRAGTSYCLYATQHGSIANIVGSVNGGIGSYSYGAYANNSATINIANDSNGGIGSYSYGAYANNSATINIANDSNGGIGSYSYGAYANNSATINIANDSNGGIGSYSYGAYAANSGAINIGNTARATHLAEGARNHNGSIYLSAIEYSESGQSPTVGEILFLENNNTACHVKLGTGSNLKLVPSGTIADYPSPADVRKNTAYNYNQSVGTCSVPHPSNVVLDAPVDATTGTLKNNANILPVTQDSADKIVELVNKLNQVQLDSPAAVIPLSVTIESTTAYVYCKSNTGVAVEGVSCNVKMTRSAEAGRVYSDAVQTVLSDEKGLATFIIPRGLGFRYEFWAEGSRHVKFSGVDSDSLELPGVLVSS